MSNSSLFEEPLLKDPDEEVISSLGFVYGKEVTKKVQYLLRDSTPFQMAASVSIFLYFRWSFLLFALDTATGLMSIFSAYMAKNCDERQHQLSHMSHMRVGA